AHATSQEISFTCRMNRQGSLCRSELTNDLAPGLGGKVLKRREIDVVADESDRAVRQLEVSSSGMIRPEVQVVVPVGQSGTESKFGCLQIVAVAHAVHVAETTKEKSPIQIIGDPPLAHRHRI